MPSQSKCTITPQTPFEDLPVALTVPEFAAWARLEAAAVYRLVSQGRLPVTRFGRAVRVPRSLLTQFATPAGSRERGNQGNDAPRKPLVFKLVLLPVEDETQLAALLDEHGVNR